MQIRYFLIICVLFSSAWMLELAHADEQHLVSAIQNQDTTTLKNWIEENGDVNYELERYGSLLHFAVEEGATEVVNLLLDNSADPNLPDGKGLTAIFNALKRSNAEIVTLLIEHGADPNFLTARGLTPLRFTFLRKNTNMLKILTENGAAIDGELLAEKGGCHTCHSRTAPGVSRLTIPFPHLAAQNKEYLYKQMIDFHTNVRIQTNMSVSARTLIEPLAEALAEYYSALPRYKNSSDAPKDVLNSGQQIYQSKCMVCHGEDGINTINPLTPTLAGFNSEYTSRQLTNYQEGVRDNDVGGVMRAVVADLSKEQIETVSAYVQDMN